VLAPIVLTAEEQLIVELINRARTNPLAEAQRYGIDLNAGLPAGTISTTPKQPLAPHQALIIAAEGHAEDMLARDFFSHTNPEGDGPTERAQDEGYPGTVGENINVRGTTGALDRIDVVYQHHADLFRSADHRRNLLRDHYSDIGTGVAYGLFTDRGTTYNASTAVEMFGSSVGGQITGVVYDETAVVDVNPDHFDAGLYNIGEGLSGVTVTARSSTGAVFTTQTGPSGGYTLAAPPGTYTLTLSGGSLNGVYVIANVQHRPDPNSFVNTKVDFEISSLPSAPLIARAHIAGRNAATGQWWVAQSTGSEFVSRPWGTWNTQATWLNVVSGDFNGDGLEDIAGRNQATGDWWVSISNGDTFTTSKWGKWSPTTNWVDVYATDVDGDGRTDLVGRVAASGDWWVARSTAAGFENQRWGTWSSSTNWVDVLPADVDGDGRADLVGRSAQTGYWWVALSNGNQFLTTRWGKWSPTTNWVDVHAADVDGDGRTDLVGRVAASGDWWVALARDSEFANQRWGTWSSSTNWVDVQVGAFAPIGSPMAAQFASGLENFDKFAVPEGEAAPGYYGADESLGNDANATIAFTLSQFPFQDPSVRGGHIDWGREGTVYPHASASYRGQSFDAPPRTNLHDATKATQKANRRVDLLTEVLLECVEEIGLPNSIQPGSNANGTQDALVLAKHRTAHQVRDAIFSQWTG